MTSLSIKSVRKCYGPVEVLHDIDLEAEPGEFVALVGPSGCGKSTLLSIIAGLESVTSGDLFIDGVRVNDLAPKDRDIAMVFQSYALYPTMTVRENMTFGMECRNVPKAQQAREVERVAALLQIEHLLARKPGQLSGGQRQRVAMGRALVRDPKLFLFDEPLSNLDAKLRVEMRTEIKRLHQRVGKTTIYVTHDQVEAMTLATRIAVMNKGVLQQYDTPAKVYGQPANMFVAGFMGSPTMNFFPAIFSSSEGKPFLTLAADPAARLSLSATNDVTLSDGQRVVVGLRPEHFSIKHESTASLIYGVVEMVEPTGSETILNVRMAGQAVLIKCAPDDAPDVGDTVGFAVDMTKICLFDEDSQKRL